MFSGPQMRTQIKLVPELIYLLHHGTVVTLVTAHNHTDSINPCRTVYT